MRTADGNQINMALAVQRVIDKYENLWSSHNGFSKHVGLMRQYLDLIKLQQQNTEDGSGGVTLDKDHAANRAIEMGIDLAGSAYVYAKSIDSETLKAQFYIPKKKLTHVQEILSVSKLKELLKNMEAIEYDVQDYVSREELDALANAIKDYEGQVAGPRAFIVDRAKSNEIVAATVVELKSNFKDMDKLISKFKKTEFESEYTRARIVIDHGKGGPGKGSDEDAEDDGPEDKEG
ncbi:hypothetical protein F0919_08890 [Taibaiella lutea]|uniref:Uncharacterized protein n=1 Tax=Taibaiella lutea TaxID=2608001 RepID=A0A5M6CNJ5_9BACT|nr:hypothetical protein [Taibaiella lutea]KAA5534719.1 hypothetical protein F0919_08890 [Taibaiella lutea]